MQDPYVYLGTEILINKFDCRNQNRLNELEADFTVLKLASLSEEPLLGEYNVSHLKSMHKYVFDDVFEWAGEFREIDIEKSEMALAGLSVEYSKHEKIESDLSDAINEMHRFDWSAIGPIEKIEAFSNSFARIWRVHPFREGNTRIITHFCCQYFDSQNEAINRKLFENNAQYLRNALAAANAVFTDIGDKSDFSYLYRIVTDALGL